MLIDISISKTAYVMTPRAIFEKLRGYNSWAEGDENIAMTQEEVTSLANDEDEGNEDALIDDSQLKEFLAAVYDSEEFSEAGDIIFHL